MRLRARAYSISIFPETEALTSDSPASTGTGAGVEDMALAARSGDGEKPRHVLTVSSLML